MRHTLVVTWLTLLGPGMAVRAGTTTATPPRGAPSLPAQDSAFHVLNRLAYGPRPGEVSQVATMGVRNWINRQLEPERIPDDVLAERERTFPILAFDQHDLARMVAEVQMERREQRLAGDTVKRAPRMAGDSPSVEEDLRDLIAQEQQLTVVRAALSERQLEEVMVDFWTNHFNVFLGKGADRFLLPSYIEHTIRPHAMGKFRDLLIATARAPAMLFYLDNWESVAPGSTPPRARNAPRLRRGLLLDDPRMRPPQVNRQPAKRAPQGINENYARELMELHTLGVDGGYTQQDVIAVARILTGWSIERPSAGGEFAFHDWAHDRGEKVVMGVRFPSGHGEDEGLRLLGMLADNHATMHHVSAKLCARFVADAPPDGCVDAAVAAWERTDGDIREILRAIVNSPEFWSPQAMQNKIKTPLEFVVSAVRAVAADPDSTNHLAQVVGRLGEPLFLHVAPDGYPEREEAWVNSGSLLERMNFAVGLAAGRLPGVRVELDSIVPATQDHDALVAAIDDRVLGGKMSDHTRQVLREQLADMTDPVQARTFAMGLALGGPDFQRQ